jgi:DNA primase
MALIRQSSIQAVLEACDMLEIVAPYTTLKKSGSNYMGRCPFHAEKTPSFTVDPSQKLYYCFGCGEGGNAFTFIEKQEGLKFADAVRVLADKYGVHLEYEQNTPQQEERRQRRQRALSLLDQAASYYSRFLWESSSAAAARDYLIKRGFSKDIIKQFRLGFSPATGQSLLRAAKAKGYLTAELLYAGLVTERGGRLYDRFRGRLMFPFTDHRGRVLGFGARVLDGSKPKYLNSPESQLYHKSKLVFGLGNARQAITQEDRVYVVEGYTDVLALSQVGIKNAVASMGTSLTEQQLREISRFTKNVYLAFDADAAGQKAMLRALELAKKLSLTVRVVEIPQGQDPADLVMLSGSGDSFRELAAAATGLLQYQVRTTLSKYDLSSVEGRSQAFRELRQLLAGAADSLERDEQLRIIADRLRLSPENMAYLIESGSSVEENDNGDETRRRVLSYEEITERNFLSLCLAHPGEARGYLQDMTDAYFTTEPSRSAFHWIRERLGGQQPKSVRDMLVSPQGAAGSILPELLIRSQSEDSTPGALHELYLRLSEAEISRRINALKRTLSQDDESSKRFKELCRLETRRREIIELIQSGSYET